MGAAADCMLSQMMAESCTTVWRLPRLALPRQTSAVKSTDRSLREGLSFPTGDMNGMGYYTTDQHSLRVHACFEDTCQIRQLCTRTTEAEVASPSRKSTLILRVSELLPASSTICRLSVFLREQTAAITAMILHCSSATKPNPTARSRCRIASGAFHQTSVCSKLPPCRIVQENWRLGPQQRMYSSHAL